MSRPCSGPHEPSVREQTHATRAKARLCRPRISSCRTRDRGTISPPPCRRAPTRRGRGRETIVPRDYERSWMLGHDCARHHVEPLRFATQRIFTAAVNRSARVDSFASGAFPSTSGEGSELRLVGDSSKAIDDQRPELSLFQIVVRDRDPAVLPDVRRACEPRIVEQMVLRVAPEIDRQRRPFAGLLHSGNHEWLLTDAKRRMMDHHVLFRSGQRGAQSPQIGEQIEHGLTGVRLHGSKIVQPREQALPRVRRILRGELSLEAIGGL
jgi:hypothetical protein